MTSTPRIGFLHTSPVHVPTFDQLVADQLPGVRAVHVVDEQLLSHARENGPDAVVDEVRRRLADLADKGADVICCTCSTIGGVAEDVAGRAKLAASVFRVDRPMATRAVASGTRIAVIAALESTLAPTEALLREEATRNGATVTIELVTATGAWERFEAGDQRGYLDAITAAARCAASRADVIVLAQASMAAAEADLTDLGIPVLSSPSLAVAHAAALASD